MATITYTAKRNLKSGHSIDNDYEIDIALMQLDDEMPRAQASISRSIGGNQVTVLNRIDEHLQVMTDYIESDGTGTPDTDDFLEFFHSVAGGESFTFNNGSDQTVVMVGNPTRVRTGVKFNYRFEMRLVNS